jgi:hypothetical protein
MPVQIPKSPHPSDALDFTEKLRRITKLTHVSSKGTKRQKHEKDHVAPSSKTNAIKPYVAIAILITCASLLLFCLSAVIAFLPDSFITKAALFVWTLLFNGGM